MGLAPASPHNTRISNRILFLAWTWLCWGNMTNASNIKNRQETRPSTLIPPDEPLSIIPSDMGKRNVRLSIEREGGFDKHDGKDDGTQGVERDDIPVGLREELGRELPSRGKVEAISVEENPTDTPNPPPPSQHNPSNPPYLHPRADPLVPLLIAFPIPQRDKYYSALIDSLRMALDDFRGAGLLPGSNISLAVSLNNGVRSTVVRRTVDLIVGRRPIALIGKGKEKCGGFFKPGERFSDFGFEDRSRK